MITEVMITMYLEIQKQARLTPLLMYCSWLVVVLLKMEARTSQVLGRHCATKLSPAVSEERRSVTERRNVCRRKKRGTQSRDIVIGLARAGRPLSSKAPEVERIV